MSPEDEQFIQRVLVCVAVLFILHVVYRDYWGQIKEKMTSLSSSRPTLPIPIKEKQAPVSGYTKLPVGTKMPELTSGNQVIESSNTEMLSGPESEHDLVTIESEETQDYIPPETPPLDAKSMGLDARLVDPRTYELKMNLDEPMSLPESPRRNKKTRTCQAEGISHIADFRNIVHLSGDRSSMVERVSQLYRADNEEMARGFEGKTIKEVFHHLTDNCAPSYIATDTHTQNGFRGKTFAQDQWVYEHENPNNGGALIPGKDMYSYDPTMENHQIIQ